MATDDELLGIAGSIAGRGALNLGFNFENGKRKNPDEEARLQRISQSSGVPIETLRGRPDDARKLESGDIDYASLERDFPSTAAFFQDKKNADVAHDDINNLKKHEVLFGVMGDDWRAQYKAADDDPLKQMQLRSQARTGVSRATDPGNPLVTPQRRLAGAIAAGGLEVFGGGILLRVAEMFLDVRASWQLPGLKSDPLASFLEAVRAARIGFEDYKREVSGVQPGESLVASSVSSGGESFGQNTPILLGAWALTPALGPLAPLAGLALMGLASASQFFTKARDQGLPVGKSLAGAGIEGTIEIATEFLPAIKVIKGLGLNLGWRGFLRTMGAQQFHELWGEQTARHTQDLNAWSLLPENKNKTLGDYFAERPNAALQTLIATAVGSLLQTGVVKGVDNVVHNAQRQEKRLFFESLAQASSENNLRKRVPERYRNMIAALTKDGPLEVVGVPPEAFKTYFQGRDMNPETVAGELGAVNYQEALMTGGDVRIPTAEFAEKIASGEHLAGLMLDLRLGDGLTEREARDLESKQDEQRQEMVGRMRAVVDEQERLAPIDAAIREITENVEGQLVAAGERSSTARDQATIMRGVAVLANRAYPDMDPVDAARQAWARYGLKIERGGAGFEQRQQVLDAFANDTEFRDNFDEMLDLVRRGEFDETRAPTAIDFTQRLYNLKTKSGKWKPAAGVVKAAYDKALQAEADDNSLVTNQPAGELSPETTPFDVPDSTDAATFRDQAGQLAAYLKSAGIDPASMSNDEVFKAVQAGAGRTLFQPAFHGSPAAAAETGLTEEDRTWIKWKPETTSTGTIKGAPAWVKTPKDVNSMFALMRKLTQEGISGRMWYEASAQGVLRITRNDPVKAEKFLQLIAIYSPNSNVWVNTLNAVKAWTQFENGVKAEDFHVAMGNQDDKAREVLYNNGVFEGRKTNSFYLNLMQDVLAAHPDAVDKLKLDPATLDELKKPVTVDVWMLRALGHDVGAASNDKGQGKYSFTENATRRITAELNAKLQPGEPRWSPHQVQAAIWTAVKTRYELPEVKSKTNAKSEKEGLIERKGSSFEYNTGAANNAAHLRNWHNEAMKSQSARVTEVAERSGRDFSSELDRLTSRVTLETVPSGALGYEINSASPEVRAQFTADALGVIVDQDGKDLLAEKVGVPLNWHQPESGAFEGAVNPNSIAHILPAKGEGAFSRAEVQLYARAAQFIFQQDAVPWFRPDNAIAFEREGGASKGATQEQMFRLVGANGKMVTGSRRATLDEIKKLQEERGGTEEIRGGKFARGIAIQFDRALTTDAQQTILDRLAQHLDNPGFTRTAENEVSVINFRDDETGVPFGLSDEEFVDKIDSFSKANGQDLGIVESKRFWSEGEYGYSHDWKKDPTGGQVLEQGGLGGRSDLHPWLRDRRAAFEAVLAEYSGEGLAAKERAVKDLRPGDRGSQGVTKLFQSPAPAQVEAADDVTRDAAGNEIPLNQRFNRKSNNIFYAGDGAHLASIEFGPGRQATISLFENRDFSSFLHEAGHFYFEVLADFAADPQSAQRVKDDYAAVLKFLKVESRDQVKMEHHEKFARAMELYLMEGKAPSPELRGVFQRFRAWLKFVYEVLRKGGLGNDKINDEIREVFDRILATDAEIMRATQELGSVQMITTPELVGWTKEQFELYSKSVEDELTAATEDLQQQLMAEYLRESKKVWRDEKKKVEAQVRAEALEMPVYLAFDILTKGETNLGDAAKLSRRGVLLRYGDEVLNALPKSVSAADGNMDPDTAGEMFGFESGEKLVTALADMVPMERYVKWRTQQVMAERHGDTMVDGTISNKAREAVHNEQRLKVIRMELRALKDKVAEVAPFLAPLQEQLKGERQERAYENRFRQAEEQQRYQEARRATETAPPAYYRAIAKEAIDNAAPRDIQPHKYLQAARKASRAAFTAMSKGDHVEAAIQKQRELQTHYSYLEAQKARDEIDKIVRHAKRFDTKATREAMALAQRGGGEYLSQIDAILNRYEFRKVPIVEIERRAALAAWVEQQRLDGREPVIDDALLDETRKVNYQSVPMTELRVIHDALKNIEHLARTKNKLVYRRQQIEFAKAEAELVKAAGENVGRSGSKNSDSAKPWTERAKEIARGLDAGILRPEQLMMWLDGDDTNGPWHRYVWQPLKDAQHDMNDDVKAVVAKIGALYGKMPKAWKDTLFDKTSLPGYDRIITRKDLVGMALNLGNAENRKKMIEGNFSGNAATADALMQRMTADDWRFAENTWDLVDSLWPEIAAVQKRLTGLEPVKVVATPFTATDADGNQHQLRGGYYPLVADRSASTVGLRQQSDLFEADYVFATTSHGHVEKRTGATYPLSFDFEQILSKHLVQVVKDYTHREAVLAVNRLLNSQTIRDTLNASFGESYEQGLRQWLRDIANDSNRSIADGMQTWNRIFTGLRANVVAATMGFKATTMISQVSGLMVSLDRVDAKHLSSALLEWGRHPLELTAEVKAASAELRHRAANMDRDIRAKLDQLIGRSGKWDQLHEWAFHGVAYADGFVAVVTWKGAFEQAKAAGMDEAKAIIAADAAVRMTQGSGAVMDQSAIQRSRDQLRQALTMFYSYFNALYATGRDIGFQVDGPKDLPRAVWRTFMVIMLPLIVGDAILGRAPGDDDEETVLWWAARKALLAPFMTVPVLRDIANALETGYDIRFSPVAGLIERGFRAVKSVTSATSRRDNYDHAISLAQTAASLAGVPGTAQAAGMARYQKRVGEGKERPDSPLEYLYNLLIGKPPDRH